MAVAVQNVTESNKTNQPVGLLAASSVGAVFVLGAAIVVLRLIPGLWDSSIGKSITSASNSFVSTALLLTLQVFALIGLTIAGTRLIANQKVKGVRGGIFFVIATIFTVFFCGRAIYLLAGRGFSFQIFLGIAINAGILFLVAQFYRTTRFADWSILLEEGGFFSTTSFKRSQGQRVRRFTIIGLLLVFLTGVWALMTHSWLPTNTIVRLATGEEVSSRLGDWVMGATLVPNPLHRVGGFTLLTDLNYTIPLVLVIASLWFAWRIVNYPVFADFLIATEAELNKVSWSSRKALIRDTIVVLTSLILITVFLFVIDVFWTWLLSREIISVLPTASEKPTAVVKDNAPQEW